MAKKKSRADLEEELDRIQVDLGMTEHELKTANGKLDEIYRFLSAEVHNGLPLNGESTIRITKRILCIIRPDLKGTLG